MSTLVTEIVAAEVTTRVTFEPGENGIALVAGPDDTETVLLGDVPSIVAALFELAPTVYRDEEFQVRPAELDALVTDGLVRMLALGIEGARAPEVVMFEHRDLGYFIVDDVGIPDEEATEAPLRALTVRPLDVWTVICSTAAEVCAP